MELIKDWPIEYIFFEHRYPVLFLSSFKGKLFLCCRVSDERCIFTRTTVGQCWKMIANKLTIREAFTESDHPVCLVELGHEDCVHVITASNPALPTQGIYFDADPGEVEEFERFCKKWCGHGKG